MPPLPSSTTRWRSNPNALHNHSIIRGASRYRRHGMIVLVMIGAELLGHRKSNTSRAETRRRFTWGCNSVANLDARPIPNASIPIPNRGASGPIAWRPYIDGSGRNVDGRRLIVARAARDRRSKQCTNGQATNNAGGYLTAPCNRSAGCKRETKTACDQQTDQKLAHIGPLRMAISVREGLRQNYWRQEPDALDLPPAQRQISSLSDGIMEVAAASSTFGPSKPGGHVISTEFFCIKMGEFVRAVRPA